jgi:nucleoside-diphosphate-sugar epimerase
MQQHLPSRSLAWPWYRFFMATAFVTGGTGFLGKNLIQELSARGDRVIAIHRPTSDTRALAAMGAELVVCGLDDVDALASAMPDGVDVVYHVAGDISWWKGNAERQRKTNVDGTRNVAEAALRRHAKRFIHTSSIAAFGVHEDVVREDTESNAESQPYGYVRTKRQGEREVLAAVERGLPAVVMNPANILGPGDVTGWARLILLVDRGKLPLAPAGIGSFCHGIEVARAHIAAATRGRIGERYLLGGADASFVELGSIIARQLGRRAPRKAPSLALRLVGAANDVVARFTGREADITWENATLFCRRFVCDSSKAIAELGYVPRSLDQMVADAIVWLRAHGHLRSNGPAGA